MQEPTAHPSAESTMVDRNVRGAAIAVAALLLLSYGCGEPEQPRPEYLPPFCTVDECLQPKCDVTTGVKVDHERGCHHPSTQLYCTSTTPWIYEWQMAAESPTGECWVFGKEYPSHWKFIDYSFPSKCNTFPGSPCPEYLEGLPDAGVDSDATATIPDATASAEDSGTD